MEETKAIANLEEVMTNAKTKRFGMADLNLNVAGVIRKTSEQLAVVSKDAKEAILNADNAIAKVKEIKVDTTSIKAAVANAEKVIKDGKRTLDVTHKTVKRVRNMESVGTKSMSSAKFDRGHIRPPACHMNT